MYGQPKSEEERLAELQKQLEEVKQAVKNTKHLTLPELLVLKLLGKDTGGLTIIRLAQIAPSISKDIEDLVNGLIARGLLTRIRDLGPEGDYLIITATGMVTLKVANDFLRLHILESP